MDDRPSGVVRLSPRCVALLLCAFSAVCAAQDGRPPLVVPAHADSVLERLPAGYAKLTPRTVTMTLTQRIQQADALLATAARTGDSRLAARADLLLASFPAATARVDVLRARAFSAQHRHDFDGAVVLLTQLIATDPRDSHARMSRAQVRLVQGRLGDARADCVALVLDIDAESGMLCTASLSLRRGDFAAAATLLDRWLAQAPVQDPRRGYALVMRAETAQRAVNRAADRWFREALALDPEDVRTLAAYARYLRRVGRDSQVEALLANVDVDGLQLQRALAAHTIGAANTRTLTASQARRYAVAHAAGSQPELRDEAEFLLSLRGRPQQALEIALRNFRSQRDYEDVEILRRAAQAAGRPDALEPLRSWATQQRLVLPEIAGGTK